MLSTPNLPLHMSTSAPVLSVSDLCVRYGDRAALDGLSFDIAPGEIMGLLGPNGAGKTTLIKSICAKLSPASGEISICEQFVKRGAENRKFVGLVPQDIGLYPHLTAQENLSVFARMFGLRGDSLKRAVETALNQVGLTGRAHDRVSALSGGMKRRINFAAAILHKPALLILDEPTAGTDVPARDSIHAVTRDLANAGYAILLVTHELESAEHLCDRILILVDGKKRICASPRGILETEFDGARECVITLDPLMSVDHASILQSLGFKRSGVDDEWRTAIDADSPTPLAALQQSLSHAGIEPREMTLRRPGLPSLFHKIEQGLRS